MVIDFSFVSIPITIIILLYTAFWIILAIANLCKKSNPGLRCQKYPENRQPLVSIIIPANNEEKVIENTIKDCLNQTYQNVEVLVIAHNCTDKTYHKAIQFKDNRVKAYNLKTKEKGKGLALNYGLKKSKGDVIACFDADAGISRDFVEKELKYIKNGYDGVQSKIVGKNQNFNMLTSLQSLEHSIFMNIFCGGKTRLGYNAGIGGTGIMLTRKALEKVGGWKNFLIEDFKLFLDLDRNNFRIAYARDCIVFDEKVPTWAMLIRQRSRWLAGHIQILKSNISFSLLKHPFDFLYLFSPICQISLYLSLILGATVCLSLTILKNPLISYFAVPFDIWLIITLITNGLFALTLVKEEGLKQGLRNSLYLPLFSLIYVNHWYLALVKAFFVKSWANTKTEHGFG